MQKIRKLDAFIVEEQTIFCGHLACRCLCVVLEQKPTNIVIVNYALLQGHTMAELLIDFSYSLF